MGRSHQCRSDCSNFRTRIREFCRVPHEPVSCAALSGVSEVRGKLGGISNRLDSTIANLDQVRVNLSAAKGRIEDADFAEETGNLAKNQIMQEASIAMVAQANASKNTVLNLIQS